MFKQLVDVHLQRWSHFNEVITQLHLVLNPTEQIFFDVCERQQLQDTNALREPKETFVLDFYSTGSGTAAGRNTYQNVHIKLFSSSTINFS